MDQRQAIIVFILPTQKFPRRGRFQSRHHARWGNRALRCNQRYFITGKTRNERAKSAPERHQFAGPQIIGAATL